jgi:hypothetical protein
VSYFSILNVKQLEFGSLLSYSPRGNSEEEGKSRSVRTALKEDHIISNPDVSMSEFVSNIVFAYMNILPFANFFQVDPVLVPVPRSGLMKKDILWVPDRLAKALHKKGLGKGVAYCLERRFALPKSATSSPQMRPKAEDHYRSLEVHKIIVDPKEIILVDDVVTRGATLLGAANKLKDSFPDARIRAFAAMRTTGSEPTPFSRIYDPKRGDITLNGHDTTRRP